MANVTCLFSELVYHMANPDNTWKPSQYFRKEVEGLAFGRPSKLLACYARGSGYISGDIGEMHVEAFYNTLQGWQVTAIANKLWVKMMASVNNNLDDLIASLEGPYCFNPSEDGARELILHICGVSRMIHGCSDSQQL